MHKILLTLFLCAVMPFGIAQEQQLQGFYYGGKQAPEGTEWESPENLSLNKEQPKAWFFHFDQIKNAAKVLPENSKYWLSLNGKWNFQWAPDPNSRTKDFYELGFDVSEWDAVEVPINWNIAGIQKNGDLKYGVPIYVNQPVIFKHTVKKDDWRGGVMRTPPADWTTYKHRNEVGSFVRSFSVPENWNGREVFVSFDGVDSFFYLWVNGRYVGFSKNSRNTASFDITKYLEKGENKIALEVYRNSDGSFLEAQDMFRLPGIFRTVALYSTPKVFIRDLVAIADLDENYKDGSLMIDADIRNVSKKMAKGYTMEYNLYANEIFSAENQKVEGVIATATIENIETKHEIKTSTAQLEVNNPNKWSAEFPYCYTLVATLKDKKDRVVDIASIIVGFREVEIKDTPASEDEFGLAGRYYYVNGKTVKLKGVNRHETNPETGHVLSRERMKQEVMLMKRANINHVRNSHYTDDPYWYYLCNLYGIYLEDEANLESHQYYYGEASLSHPKEWRDAHVARVMEMVHSNINNPSIVIWSLGNEAGPGDAFIDAYDELKKVDKSRPVQYERNNSIVDMGSNQYPSIGWMREAVKGKYKIKYPFHVSEYAHSMGNACGNLDDYWEAIESTNFFCGAAIWDWIDQSMYNYDKETGKRYLAYGGDFGDTPNDGQFVMNGIVFADMEPKPQYYEVKKVFQHIGVKGINVEKGVFEIFNKYYFSSLSAYDVKWSLYENGTEINSGILAVGDIAPRTKKIVTIPYVYDALSGKNEYFVKIQFLLTKDKPWAKKGFVQAEEQILVKTSENKMSIAETTNDGSVLELFSVKENNHIEVVEGNGFEVKFDTQAGTIYSLTYGDEKIIDDGNGPKLDALRAFVNNDNWFYPPWFENGIHNLQHKVTSSKIYKEHDGRVILSFMVVSQAPNAAKIHGGTSSGKNSIEELTDVKFDKDDFKFTTNQIWTVYKDGSVELQANITSSSNIILPRLGYMIKMPHSYNNFTYYGRGPVGNYADRKVGQFIEQYTTIVENEFVNFPKPQDMSNHEDVRWCSLTNQDGVGAMFIATDNLSVSALPYSALDLTLASHIHKLSKSTGTYLHLDLGVTGLGGNSCGQGGPLVEDRIYSQNNNIGFIIRPVTKDTQMSSTANVSPAGILPISISRSNFGVVIISSLDSAKDIYYSINGSKEKRYVVPLTLRDGGSVTAWFKGEDNIKPSVTFGKIESVNMEVIYASSEESGSGDASHLTDGDSNTIWHTMYSVTMAKHPHWVDFDAGKQIAMKGFIYIPRRNSTNGNIKDYTIHVSVDGTNWGEPIYFSSFTFKSEKKRVVFDDVVDVRYIRFTALSSYNNKNYASGSEFIVLAD